MADVVADMRAAVLAQMATTLGATYQRLPFIYDAGRNDIARAKLGYGCRALGGSPAESQLNRTFIIDQGFEMIFSDTYAKDTDDSQKETAIDVMFDKADEVMKALVNTKLSMAATVLYVGMPTYGEPEEYRRAKLVVLRVQFIAKYRTSLS